MILLAFETISLRELSKKSGRIIWPAHIVRVPNRRTTDLRIIVKECSQLFKMIKISQVVLRISLNSSKII